MPPHLYDLGKEDRGLLASLMDLPDEWRSFSRPTEILVDWHKTENQGPVGSCQGNGLTSLLERLQFVAVRKASLVIQLSRMFAYLATQKIDGLLGGDNGSTISGGVKLALEWGVCPESVVPYFMHYPTAAESRAILNPSNYEAGKPFKAKNAWRVPVEPDLSMDFIGGGGGISLGLAWYSGLIPQDRIVRSFRPPRRAGGHAMAVLGYTKDGKLIAVNSHADGIYFITPEAWSQIISESRTAAIGLTGSDSAKPVDWATESQWFVKRSTTSKELAT